MLITLGSVQLLPRRTSASSRNVDAARTSAQFYAPGPIVEAEILKPTHPIFYGYDQKIDAGALGQRSAAAACRESDRDSRS